MICQPARKERSMPDNSHEPRPDTLTEEQRGRIKRRGADQDRTLLAMQQLEAALGAAAPHREKAWRDEVRRTLTVLGEAAAEEVNNAAQPDSLLSDIARTQPWLRNRVRGLRIHYRQLCDATAALQDELHNPDDSAVDFTDIRQRLAWVLAGLRHQRARESDLIYEAYYDAVRSDIDEDTDRPPSGRQHQLSSCPFEKTLDSLLVQASWQLSDEVAHRRWRSQPCASPGTPVT
jgi:hypothetical protein